MSTLSKFLLSTALCIILINPAYGGGKKALTVWLLDQSNTEAFERLRKSYRKKNNGVEINYHTISWEEASKIYRTRKDFEEGTKKYGTPDVMQVPSTWASHFIESLKILSSIDIPGIEYKPEILPSFKNNKEYFLPWFLDVRVLYYRKEFLKEAGLDESNLTDWDGFIAACGKIKKKKMRLITSIYQDTGKPIYRLDDSGGKKVLPLGVTGMLDVGWNIIHNIIAPHYWARTNDQIKGPITTDNVKNQLEDDIDFYCDLVSSFIPVRDLDKDEGAIQREFVMGLYAMHFSGPHLIGKLKEIWGEKWHEHIGVVNIPGINNLKTSFYGGSYLGIHKHSERKPEALKFIKYCAVDQKAQIQYSKNVCMIPAGSWLKNDHTDEIANSFKQNNTYWEKFLDAPNLRTYPSDPAWFYVEQELPSSLSELKNRPLYYRIRIFSNKYFYILVLVFLMVLTISIGILIKIRKKVEREDNLEKEEKSHSSQEQEGITQPLHDASEEITQLPDKASPEEQPIKSDKKEWPDPVQYTVANVWLNKNGAFCLSTVTNGEWDGKVEFKKASKQMQIMMLLCCTHKKDSKAANKSVQVLEIAKQIYLNEYKRIKGNQENEKRLIKNIRGLISDIRNKKLIPSGINPNIISPLGVDTTTEDSVTLLIKQLNEKDKNNF